MAQITHADEDVRVQEAKEKRESSATRRKASSRAHAVLDKGMAEASCTLLGGNADVGGKQG